MSALAKVRSERDRMSAIERRIADFILENAQLLRDYSSQQLANALGISQSSVVKFCQKLGYKGYPDLKLSVSEAVVRADNGNGGAEPAHATTGDGAGDGATLWQRKSEAEEATRLINPPGTLAMLAEAIGGAGTVFIIGVGEDDIHARAFALRLSLLGILTVHNFDPAHMTASLSAARAGDVLLVFSEHGMQGMLCQLCRHMHEQGGRVASITRHSSNALRAQQDQRPITLQHLLDRVYIRLCEADDAKRARLQGNLDRLHPLREA